MGALTSLLELPIAEQELRGLTFTPQEIAQQPETWRRTAQLFESEQEKLVAFLERAGVVGPLEKRPVVMLIGAGTSDYIGESLAPLLRKRWGCETSAVASTSLLPSLSEYVVPGRRYLWISFSRSGDSPEGVNVLEQALEMYPEISHLVVTCNPHSRMAALAANQPHACTAVLDDAVNDRSLAMTSSFTNMVIFGQCLAHARSFAEYQPILEGMIASAKRFIADSADLSKAIAEHGTQRICMIGSGSLAAVAQEASLKVLEMSGGHIKTMSQTSLGLRHGPMAALDSDTDLICFLSSERTRVRYEIDLLREIRAKKITATCIVVGLKSSEAEALPFCDIYHAIDGSFPDAYRPPVDVIFGQLLGLYSSISLGLRPDAPSPAGVINRVVSDFTIYR
ncbi:SIS domain-containing protein [Terriglobus saanensis]|uniref:Sugar isomerase (SIS) n=1 Tax=Terriglobus saanensis (strain ATCC BAA-1853 / DSM 23119 / SP1PR4) TaxID=401053 RepID=E8V065_TERSS|nr:SIS domain-containing protein [Terriglobus saanensis]ADV83283.1 sugar isomerase (SIS) [Terriglobus saanensis SP1PR4]